MRALVISGGGSKGAFAGGVAECLIRDRKIDYQIFSGSSTGALLAPMLASGDIERVKEVYMNVSTEDVFSHSPFIFKKQKDGSTKAKINHWNILRQFLKGKRTFGESTALRDLIENTFTIDHYELLKNSDKRVVVSVSNFTNNVVEFKYLSDHSYEDFCDWIWLSANFVPFMSLVRKNGKSYADGGFGAFIPIEEAIDAGAKDLDVIILTPRHRYTNKEPAKNAFGILLNSLDFMLAQIAKDEKYIALLESMHHGLNVRYFHTPRELTENPLLFEPTEMRQWWIEGKIMAQKILEKIYHQ